MTSKKYFKTINNGEYFIMLRIFNASGMYTSEFDLRAEFLLFNGAFLEDLKRGYPHVDYLMICTIKKDKSMQSIMQGYISTFILERFNNEIDLYMKSLK